MSLIAYSIPVFFTLIGAEWLWSRRKGVVVYRWADTLADLSCGIMQQILTAGIALLTIPAYIFVQRNFALFELQTDLWWTWALCFVGVDFAYYWFHRSSHRISALWAAHVVHHQSEEYNLSVALRQSALQPAFSWVFYLPLAVIGFPPTMFFILAGVNTLYQFWIHTRLITTMGPLEWVLNTPSHHRVHHGQNDEYIDRNHAGVLIIWDRMFKTFEPERAPVIYGVRDPSASWNPLYVNLHYWKGLLSRVRRTVRLQDKLRLFWAPPGWLPDDLANGDAVVWPAKVYDPPMSRRAAWIAGVVLATAVGLTLWYLLVPSGQAPALKVMIGAVGLGGVISVGVILDGRLWPTPSEAQQLR